MRATISSNNNAVAVMMMIMYEDESVDVRYEDGSRVLLSPCGSEFVLVKAPDPTMHPLYTSEKVRQRTRFAISTYKDLMMDILAFRNKYALQPYLPEELTPAAQIKPFFSIDPYVEWPESSSCGAVELGACGETVIRSVDGRASVTLSSSGEEFSVEFMCGLSQPPNQQHRHESNRQITSNVERNQNELKEKRNKEEEVRRSCSPQFSTHRTAHPKPEKMYRSATVVQHCSCAHVSPVWRYPVSLARRHRAIRGSEAPGDVDASQTCRTMNTTVESCGEERKSRLPEALPLTCTSPHQHRWKFNDLFVSDGEHSELTSEQLIKVIWCQGVIYRILSGTTPVIEVSPGDGSVIRSNGALNSYFTHHRTESHSAEVKEVTYHLNSLPPDIPGQVYSVDSIVTLASRIQMCYQSSVSLMIPAAPSCLEQNRRSSQPVSFEQEVCSSAALHHGILVPQMEQSRSTLVDSELEKIKRFNFLLENSSLPETPESSHERTGSAVEAEAASKPVDDDCIAEALKRTSRAIKDIDTLLSATTIL